MTQFRYSILSAVSSKKQAEGTSLEDQIQICRRMSERGWVETEGPYIVRGQNRTQYLNLRDAEDEIPALRDLLEGARHHKYDVLVVYDHDRLRDLLSLVYASLCDYGVQLFSVSAQNNPVPPDEYDPYENDTNDLLIGINQIKSKAEIARMRRKYRTGMRNRILVYHLPVQIPFGYRRPLAEQYNRKAIPEQIPSITEHLIEIKDRFLKGQSTSQLKEYLEQNQIAPPKGSVWHLQTIRDILRNPFYAGLVQFEKSKVKKDRRFKQKSRDRHIAQDKIISSTGLHQPLWDHAAWLEIDAELKRRSRKFRGRQNNQFTGLIHCGECDSPAWRQKNGPRSVPDRLIWRCSEYKSQHISMTHVELLDRVGSLLMNSLQNHMLARQTETTPEKKIKHSAYLQDLIEQRTRLEDAYLRGLFSVEKFELRAAVLDEKIKTATDENTTAQVNALQRESLTKMLMASLGAQAKHIPAWLKAKDPSEINRILHLLLEKIILHPNGTVELVYR